ncbi:MAG: hypothetical protein SGILL_004523 [Bacillariaceae sp.]
MSDGKNAVGDTFPMKLHRLLREAEQFGKTDVIAWLPDGTKFKVVDKTRFASEIMPHYFSSSTFKSFQRSKNLWGYQTVSKGVHKGECSHPMFLRNNPDLCRKMVRTKHADAPDPVVSGESSPPLASVSTSGMGIGQTTAGGSTNANILNQALLSGMNPSLLMFQQQQAQQAAQQQQQMPSLSSLLATGGLGNSNQSSANPLVSALTSSLGNGGGGNASLLAALQRSAPPPPAPAPPPPAPQASTLQQLLQLAALQQLQQQQQAAPPASSVNEQLLALLAQRQQQPSSVNAAASNTANLGSPPLPSISSPPVQSIEMHTLAKKSKSSSKPRKSPKKTTMKSEQKKKSNGLREAALAKGAKVIACRARGMSMDHNMHTAFFEIPQEPKHGMELVCSFALCRNGGIKFLWCKYCEDVIAKRTFKANHLHKDLVNGENGNLEVEAAEAAAPAPADGSDNSKGPPKKRHKKNADKGAAKNVHEISNETTDSSSSSASDNVEISAADREKLTKMRTQWDALLDERQEMDSKDEMKNWLDRVVETSERFKMASRKAKRKAKA